MKDQLKTACVFGGTGFVGRYIVQELARKGVTIKIASRTPQSAYFLRPYGNVGQIVPVFCDYSEKSIINAVQGCDIVVNSTGILYQKGKNSFKKIHAELPKLIAKACKKNDVKRFVHLSALGVQEKGSKYGKSKLAGEEAILKNFPTAVILRPSVIFGREDDFFNRFAKMMGYMPFMPLVGGNKPKFQPVYVCDVANAAIKTIFGSDELQGRIYALGGPEKVGFKEVYDIISKETGRSKPMIKLPFWIAKIQGFFLQLLPGAPLLTVDQVRSLKNENVVKEGQLSFQDLDIKPTAMSVILPSYLSVYKEGGTYLDKKQVSV